MKTSPSLNYSTLILLHVAIGLVVFVLPFLSKLYCISIFGFGIYYIIKTRNQNNEALVASAYVISAEVLLRMTDGMFFNEYAKYTVMIFLFVGMIYTGFSKNAAVYWFFLILLVPSIILSTVTLNFETNIRKAIAFNISGPVCLGISAIYCYQRKISFSRMKEILTISCYPLIAIVTYLVLYTPSIKSVVTNTQSNFETSGGFGPNQMSTILGFGIFVFFVQLILNSPTRKLQILNASLVIIFAFRGLVTFSRGGVMTGVMMILLLTLLLYYKSNKNGKLKISVLMILIGIASLGVWSYSTLQTNGMINKRYANEDARGRQKKSKLSGREAIIESEIDMFLENPIFGVGVGKNREYREETTGINAASHNEISRMMAEHGSLGIMCLLILIITPLLLYLNNNQNIFVLSCIAFWIMTINHAAMRIAAPAFVYALSLLKVYSDEKPTLHRK
jgi:hypothetical protein